MSRCIHTSLLRLQEIWLAKFVMIGLVIPGDALMRNKLPTELGAVLGNFAICTAYAIVSSGHLPLMMPMLLLAGLAEGQDQEKQSFTQLSTQKREDFCLQLEFYCLQFARCFAYTVHPTVSKTSFNCKQKHFNYKHRSSSRK